MSWHKTPPHTIPPNESIQGWSGITHSNISTPCVAKHRSFVWLDARTYSDSALIAIARDDGTTFGILHNRFHEA